MIKTPGKMGRLCAPLIAGALTLSACTNGTSGNDEGEGVPLGSDAAAYQEALAEMSPVTLTLGGMFGPKGSPTTDAYDAWGEVVEDWSGGKISVEVDYAGAKVPINEAADAIEDGRLDLGRLVPSYQAEEWPAFALISGVSHFGHPDPIAGRLASFGALTEFGQNWEPIQEEFAEHSIMPLYPFLSGTNASRLMCANVAVTDPEDLEGKSVRVGDASWGRVVEALGGSPVSLPTTELYQALQRGVVDCAVSSLNFASTSGMPEITDHWMFGGRPGAIWNETPTSFGMNQQTWDDLPLAARQLLWDTQKQMLEAAIRAELIELYSGVASGVEGKVEFTQMSPETMAVFEKQYAADRTDAAKRLEDGKFAEDGEQLIEEYQAVQDKWMKIVSEELDYPDDVPWESLPDSYSPDMSEVDLKPFVDRLYEDVLASKRPS